MTSAPTQVVVPPTRGATRRLAMAAYALALLVWSLTIGIPSDTLGVCLWIFIGTVAWHAAAPVSATIVAPRKHRQTSAARDKSGRGIADKEAA